MALSIAMDSCIDERMFESARRGRPHDIRIVEHYLTRVAPVESAPRNARTREAWQAFLQRRYRRIGALNERYLTSWTGFDEVPLPDDGPAAEVAVEDWRVFESTVLPIRDAAHRFSVLIPTPRSRPERPAIRRRLELARRIVALEKPAHTTFDVDLYWALFRLGAARIGHDTVLEAGSRAPELLPEVVLGLDYVGESHIARRTLRGRTVLECA
jgi:hypothetical protein